MFKYHSDYGSLFLISSSDLLKKSKKKKKNFFFFLLFLIGKIRHGIGKKGGYFGLGMGPKFGT